jgi:hypothetical protein
VFGDGHLPLLLQVVTRAAQRCIVGVRGLRELFEFAGKRFERMSLRAAAILLGLARAGARFEHCAARAAELLPQRALITLWQHKSLGVGLPARLQLLHPCGRVALCGLRAECVGLGDQ